MQPKKTIQLDPCLWLPLILATGVMLKVVILAFDRVPFNADEAIVALMARHVLQGERPVFFYGQAYMGSLDAFLTAAVFRVVGEQVWGIRLVQTLLYLFTMLTTYYIGKQFFGSVRTGLIAAGLLAIPPVNLTLYTTASLGGYGEALLIGNLMLLAAWRVKRLWEVNNLSGEKSPSSGQIPLAGLIWGFLCGLGLWANGLTMVYAAPSAVLILYAMITSKTGRAAVPPVLFAALGFFLGSLPWWGYALQNGFGSLIGELMGQAVAVESDPYGMRVLNHLVGFLLFGLTAMLGLRPPWEVAWLGLPLIPFVLAIWIGIGWYWLRRLKNDTAAKGVLNGVVLIFALAFLLTSFGVDSSGRYFLPLGVVISLAAGRVMNEWMDRKPAAGLVVVLLLGFHLWGNIQCGLKFPPGFTTQFYAPARVDMRALPEVMDFLEQQGEVRGYTNYWVAYPLAFLSREGMLFSPRLPYHPDLRYTARDDRIPDYTRQVEASERVAFITTLNPLLDEQLRAGFRALDMRWQETRIGDFRIYYNLSAAPRIDQLAAFIYR